MYIWEGRGLGEPLREPWRVRLGLRPKPQYLRFLILDQFNWNEASLTPRLRQMVVHLAAHVKASAKTMRSIGFIRLIGHTDNTGPEIYNVNLGDRRARAVKEELERLLKEDIVDGRIRIAILVEPSPGKSAPIADVSTPKGRALNRRVEVFIAPPEPPIEPGKKPNIWVTGLPPRSVIETDTGDTGKIPPAVLGRSFKEWVTEACSRHFSASACSKMAGPILSGSCGLLEVLFEREGGRLSTKQKEDFRKQCREAGNRRVR